MPQSKPSNDEDLTLKVQELKTELSVFRSLNNLCYVLTPVRLVFIPI